MDIYDFLQFSRKKTLAGRVWSRIKSSDPARFGDNAPPAATLQNLTRKLEEIKQLLSQHMLENRVDRLTNEVKQLKAQQVEKDDGTPKQTGSEPNVSLRQAIENLKNFATNRVDLKTKQTMYLLHRATKDYEYERSIRDGSYETSEPTDWVTEFPNAEAKRIDANPVVSVWVPEQQIRDIPHPHSNTSIWGDLGTNPSEHRYTIVIKPGQYVLYQQLKKAEVFGE